MAKNEFRKWVDIAVLVLIILAIYYIKVKQDPTVLAWLHSIGG